MHKNIDGSFDWGENDGGGAMENTSIVVRSLVKVLGTLLISWGAVKIARRNLSFLLDNIEKKCEKEE